MDVRKIVSITASGLTYRDETGMHFFIDFEQCKKSYATWLQKENELTDEETMALESKTRYVAIRDAFATPKYIEFFMDPPVRFEFKKSFFQDDYKSFRRLDAMLNEVGWSTFDMG